MLSVAYKIQLKVHFRMEYVSKSLKFVVFNMRSWFGYAYFCESWAPRFRRCARDASHKHIEIDDFHESPPGPSQERSDFDGFL